MISRRRFNKLLLSAGIMGTAGCRPGEPARTPAADTTEQTDLLIWWEHGYLPEENEGIIRIVQDWERVSGRRALLKLVPDEFIGTELPKIDRGLRPPPDLVFSIGFTTQHAPSLAWRGELRDLTALLEPARARYAEAALSQVRYLNRRTGTRAYYALPIGQSDDFIHYWRSGLEAIGRGGQDVPQEWDEFWAFWCKAQDDYRLQGKSRPYGLGLCLSPIGFDFYMTLMLFLAARGVTVADARGFVPLDDTEQRAGLTEVFAELAGYYQQGYVPPAALDWSGSGNNISFLEGEVLMTHNLTLSIPVTQKQTNDPYNWDAGERYRQIVTLDRPLRVAGRPLPSRKSIKQIIAPVRGRHPEAAEDFLRFLLEDDRLKQLAQGFKGRIFPVMPEHLRDPYWNVPDDPHFGAALRILDVPAALPYEVIHPVFSDLEGRQLWAHTLRKIVRQNVAPAAAIAWLTELARQAQDKYGSPA